MRYLIGVIFSIITLVFLATAVFCAYKAFTGDIYLGFVMVGLMFPTAVSFLIAQAGISAAREY